MHACFHKSPYNNHDNNNKAVTIRTLKKPQMWEKPPRSYGLQLSYQVASSSTF